MCRDDRKKGNASCLQLPAKNEVKNPASDLDPSRVCQSRISAIRSTVNRELTGQCSNLLAHTRRFKAGIARSGAYNRTLTPFGFQAEERNYWQAQDTYLKMSPFNHAGDIKDAILFIHGADDNNSGTFPMQSERMFAAVKGLGGTARLVMLPNESHGYRARESIMTMLAESEDWLDRWLAAPAKDGKRR